MKKTYKLKCMQNIPHHKELHHTCLNTAICKEHTSPNEDCGDCKYYKLSEVEVADNPIRHKLDWGFDENGRTN